MEKEDSFRPRASLEEKPPLEQSEDKETKQSVESHLPQEEETDTPDDNSKDPVPKEKEWEYITGLKLVVVIIAVTAAAFLMLLDNSIVSTVSESPLWLQFPQFTYNTGYSSDYQ